MKCCTLAFSALIAFSHVLLAGETQLEIVSVGGQPSWPSPFHVVSGIVEVQTILEVSNTDIRPTIQFAHRASLSGVIVAELTQSPSSFALDTTRVADGVHFLTFEIDEPGIYPRAVILIVDNVPGPAAVTQAPACGFRRSMGGTGPAGFANSRCHWVPYPPPEPASFPFPYGLAAPFQIIPSREDLMVEHILPSTGLFREVYRWWRSSHGEPFVASFDNRFGTTDIEAITRKVDRLPFSDGRRGKAYVSSAINGAVHPVTGELYFVEHGFERGRLGKISLDGTITTVAGFRLRGGVLPYHPSDAQADHKSNYELVGDFSAYPPGRFATPMDLAFDRTDPQRLFVADSYNHRVALVDIGATPAVVTSFAGGNGEFNLPFSVAPSKDGLYVVDRNNMALKLVDGNGISTMATFPVRPLVARMAGHGTPLEHVYVLEETTGAVYHWQPNTLHLSIVTRTPETNTWMWMDVDRGCAFGPCGITSKGQLYNQLFVTYSGPNSSPLRFDHESESWTRVVAANVDYENRASMASIGHYPWMIALGNDGSLWSNGLGSLGVQRVRLARSASEMPLPDSDADAIKDANGQKLWNAGCGDGCRWGSVPSYSVTHGPRGVNFLGMPSAIELADLGDAELDQVLRDGAGTGIPRDFTPEELSDLRFFLRNSSPYAVRGLSKNGQPVFPSPQPIPQPQPQPQPPQSPSEPTPAPPPAPSPICGNRMVEPPEQCDDGNRTDGDGCSGLCKLEDPSGPITCGKGTYLDFSTSQCRPIAAPDCPDVRTLFVPLVDERTGRIRCVAPSQDRTRRAKP